MGQRGRDCGIGGRISQDPGAELTFEAAVGDMVETYFRYRPSDKRHVVQIKFPARSFVHEHSKAVGCAISVASSKSKEPPRRCISPVADALAVLGRIDQLQ